MSFEKFNPKKYKKPDRKYTLRLSSDFYEEVADYAQKNDVSMNTLIINCIQYAFSNREE